MPTMQMLTTHMLTRHMPTLHMPAMANAMAQPACTGLYEAHRRRGFRSGAFQATDRFAALAAAAFFALQASGIVPMTETPADSAAGAANTGTGRI